MFAIQQITNDALQEQTLLLPSNGAPIVLTLNYVPLQYMWLIKRITYGDFVAENIRICVSPNMLYQFKNLIPFGIACYSQASREPTLQQDFISGAAKLYLLTEEEVAAYTEFLADG